MGKQLPIIMTLNDEKIFISQIKNISDFILVESFADTENELFVDNFNEKLENHFMYYLWDKKLKWEPKFKYANTIERKIYIANTINAPFISFSRQHIYPEPFEKGYGRIYINTFTVENLPYDKNELIKTYNEIVKIIKKTSAGKIKDGLVVYFYPEGWKNYQK
jgi:hypothetical protein